MAIPILKNWQNYFTENPNEGLGSSYERIVLNKKLIEIIKKYNCDSILEVPSFGFTGVSGINSMFLSKQDYTVTVIDNDEERTDLIKHVWEDIDLNANIKYQKNFNKIEFSDNSFDMSWNFSSLWFVNNLDKFLSELNRVTRKVILICVPNRSGLGYLSQKYFSGSDLREHLNEKNIIPKNFIPILRKYNWKLVNWNYIDCPPWPDIGMEKEKFLELLHLNFLLRNKSRENKNKENICILDFYNNNKPNFDKEMLKYSWLEKIAPKFFKHFWAHHKYFLFIKN